jgi:nucleotide-binding universal stress UspA family protein
MAFKMILAPIQSGESARQTLAGAYAVASKTNAHIQVLHAQADAKEAVPLLGEGMSGAMIEEMIEIADRDAAARASEARTLFDQFCSEKNIPLIETPGDTGDKVSASWRELNGREDEIVADAGKAADLIIIAQPNEEDDRSSLMTLHAAVFETGKPVLMVPPDMPESFCKTAAISWNGTAEAARAVTSSIPLLKLADQVTVFAVETDKSRHRTSAEEIVTHLAWHGVAATHRTILPSYQGQSVGESIATECQKENADLLVMGAFTHSRLVQIVLGGVTRYVIASSKLPVLMNH